MKASPQFLGPMRHVKGSGFKQGTFRAPLTGLPPSGGEASGVGREVCACTLALAAAGCFGRPSRLQGPLSIFCLGAIFDKVIGALADETTFLLLLISLDGLGHPYCKSPFSVIRLTKKVRNVEARKVL